MTTRCGKEYHPTMSTKIEEGAAAGVAELMKMIIDKRKQHDKEMAAGREAESKKQFELSG